MKKIMITGGAGFVAHHVVEYFLRNTAYEIVCLDRLDFSGDLNRLQQMSKQLDVDMLKRLKVVHHDLKAEINSYVSERIGDVDVILHLAAASHVTRSIQYPMEFINDNIIGTANLLEFARKLKKLERMIYFSTDEVFGSSIGEYKFKEYDRYNATNPYSASKAAGEELCVAYHNTYGVPIYITHTMNIFGERQSYEKYIPMTIRKIYEGKKITIHYDSRTNSIGSRTYLHAKDVADALLFLLNLNEFKFPNNHIGGKCPKFNISSDEEYNNLEIAKIISEIMKVDLDYELVDPNVERPGHDMRYLISGEYMASLGWRKKRTVAESLVSVVRHTLEELKA